LWSRDGKKIAFVSAIFPEFLEKPFKESDEANKKKIDENSKNPVKAKVFKRLFYRHWDSYVEDKRQHLFVINADGTGAHDATPGDRDAYPTSTTSKPATTTHSARTANTSCSPRCRRSGKHGVPITTFAGAAIDNTSTKWESLTGSNPAADSGPVFSPDGKKLAYRRRKRPATRPTNGKKPDDRPTFFWTASGAFQGAAPTDRPPEDWTGPSTISFGPCDNTTIFFTAEENGASRSGVHTGQRRHFSVVKGENNDSAVDQQRRATALHSANAATTTRLRRHHRPLRGAATRSASSRPQRGFLAELNMPKPESVEVPVEGGVKMQVDPQTAGVSSQEEVSGRVPGPRRPAGGVGGRLGASARCPEIVGGRWDMSWLCPTRAVRTVSPTKIR